jgi:S1-C subfamily serine protease
MNIFVIERKMKRTLGKSESRRPKVEGRPKAQIRRLSHGGHLQCAIKAVSAGMPFCSSGRPGGRDFRNSRLRVSFGFRISDFGLSLFLCLVAWGSIGATENDVRRDATVEAVEKVMPSVVNIATETIIRVRDPFEEWFRQFWDQYHRPQKQYSLGSGVIIDEAGYVLTNDHVVRRADKIAVRFAGSTNEYGATVVVNDPKSDVALLKLDAPPGERFSSIKFAKEDDLLLGETVLALGNPFGLGGSVTRGILSSKSRLPPKEGEALDIPNWLQTDAPINFGNSGGPLVNLRGELIGINVAVLDRAQGIGFAIPIKRVMEALSEIFPTECVKSLYFGARVKVGTMPLIITTVQPQSPASRAGLESGDAILEVNGKAPKSFIDFSDLLAGPAKTDPAKREVALTVGRGTSRRELLVRLLPEKEVFNGELIQNKLGLDLEEMTAQQAARYGMSPSDAFLIAGVQDDSPAAAAGLQRGILVTAIDGQVPTGLTAAAKLLHTKKKGEPVQLEIAARQRLGNFNMLRQGTVELVSR